MGSYYYLVSQLPYLMYGQTPPVSSESFRDMARPLLSVEDAALLDMLSLDPQPLSSGSAGYAYADSAPSYNSDFIDKWREWEWALRLNLARHRAIKLQRENVGMEPPAFPLEAAALASRAVAMESPLEGELFLDKARWSAIEIFQGGDYFDRNTIFAYLLKLMLLERCASFQQVETGFSEYKSLYASIMESARSGISPVGESEW